MKKVVAASVAVALAAGAIVLAGRAGATRQKEEGVEVARVTRRDVGSVVKATGIIKPMVGAEVRVGSRASGVVSRLFVRIGDTVETGQILALLDNRELAARREQAAAALGSAQAELSYAQADLRRKRELSVAQLLASSDLDLAERNCALAEQRAGEARASLDYATTQLGFARIQAPISGVVASISTQEGETVAASLTAPTFVTLVDLGRLEVRAYVDETDIGRVRVAQQARFTVDTYPDREFEGAVTAVYPQAEIRDNVVNYVTVVKFDPPRDGTLRPEMTTTVKVAIETHPSVLAVPRRAVRREGGRTFVWLRKGETRERRFVTTGARDEVYWEIASGLGEGDEVVVSDVKTGEGNQQ